jgi:hypothetical protein
MVMGVDTSKVCDTFGNVDFVHFLWDNINHFGYHPHPIYVASPIFPGGSPLLLFLRHYMAAASGWVYGFRCVGCRDMHRYTVRSLSGFVALREFCTSNVCRRQPQSLTDLALNTVYTQVRRDQL